MARGINKVILVGNCGQDPETRYTSGGAAITNISIATSESWKDKQTGQQQERTEWHRVVFFNRLGEIAGEYLRKGSKVYVEGSLRTRKWQDQQGVERYTTEIVGAEMQMLDTRANAGGGYDNSGYDQMGGGQRSPQSAPQPSRQQAPPSQASQSMGGGAPAPQQPSGAPQRPSAPQTPAAQPAPAMDSFDDDIPF